MHSRSMSRRLGVMALILTVAGPAGRLAAADAALPQSVTRAQFEAWFKEISNWGRWGKDDELGTLNLITPEKREGRCRTGARRRVSLAGTGTATRASLSDAQDLSASSPHRVFRAVSGQHPCGTFIESRTGSQAMATLQYRMFGLAALCVHPSRPVAQTLRCAFKRS